MKCVKVNFHLTWKFITRVLFSFTITVRKVYMFNAQCIERDIAYLINTMFAITVSKYNYDGSCTL